jgi:transcriptional regulator with XRE-family HTH domain
MDRICPTNCPTVSRMEDKRLTRDIARVVRGILAERKMTVTQFSALMGEPNSNVSRWVSGAGPFNTDKLEAMAEALGMSVPDLVALALERRATAAERQDLRAAMERKRQEPPDNSPGQAHPATGSD